MSKDLISPNPEAFGMASFAELLSSRSPILGEAPGTFDAFHDGLMRSLAPMTPYECAIAENLVAIEWELFQQRRMRAAALRMDLRQALHEALVRRESLAHEQALDADWERHVAAGGDEDAWKEPFEFDEEAASEAASDLAERAVSEDRDVQAKAQEELVRMGLSPIDFMSEAYAETFGAAVYHDTKIQELERRRREVKRDYDSLQKARPVVAEVEEAELVGDDIAARDRANSEASTGPRSVAGKAAVAGNARQHGATARPDPESVAAWLAVILDRPGITAADLMPSDERGFRALALAQAAARRCGRRPCGLRGGRGGARRECSGPPRDGGAHQGRSPGERRHQEGDPVRPLAPRAHCPHRGAGHGLG